VLPSGFPKVSQNGGFRLFPAIFCASLKTDSDVSHSSQYCDPACSKLGANRIARLGFNRFGLRFEADSKRFPLFTSAPKSGHNPNRRNCRWKWEALQNNGKPRRPTCRLRRRLPGEIARLLGQLNVEPPNHVGLFPLVATLRHGVFKAACGPFFFAVCRRPGAEGFI